jgi:hypothetical protein
MNRKKTILFVFLLLVGGQVLAQTISRVGTTAAPFLKIGVGSRATSMGNAYTTIADDASAMYWNPAGTSRLTQLQALYSHYYYFADITYDYGCIAIPISGVGMAGAFFSYMNYGEIDRTTVDFPDGTGEQVSASSLAVGFSYSRGLTDRFSMGGNVKYVREGIWHSVATSLAFDLGLQYKTFFKNLTIGMSISNFGSAMKMDGRDLLVQHDISGSIAGNNPNLNSHLDTDEFPLPMIYRVGISNNIAREFLGSEEHDWIIAVDAVHPNDNQEYLNMGTEIRLYNKLLSLRAGYRGMFLSDQEDGLTFGAGLGLDVSGGRLDLDFAYVKFGRLGNQNMLTIILTY